MPHKERHVVPNTARGGWDSKRENTERGSRHFEANQAAMDWSNAKAKEEGSELLPHGRGGKIQNPNSCGSDPHPPKDKRR